VIAVQLKKHSYTAEVRPLNEGDFQCKPTGKRASTIHVLSDFQSNEKTGVFDSVNGSKLIESGECETMHPATEELDDVISYLKTGMVRPTWR